MSNRKVTAATALERRRKRRDAKALQSAIEQSHARKLRADGEIAAGALETPLASLDSFDAIRRRVQLGYHQQGERGGPLTDDAASLMFRALELATESDGLTKAVLHDIVHVGEERFYRAFERLRHNPRVSASKEIRHNRAGRNQLQWVIRLKSRKLQLAEEEGRD